jgi:ATPase subunit of ABC transporter with duplicated ATPase domains
MRVRLSAASHGHVEQDVPDLLRSGPLRDVVQSALSPEAQEAESWRVDIVLDDLHIPEELRDCPLGELSGGWQRAGHLARAWVTEPDLLLMDECTNHLDLSRIGFLQDWLATVARGVPVVAASHDPAFLDAITNRTLFLRDERSRLFALPFTPARAALAQADAADEQQFENDKALDQQRRPHHGPGQQGQWQVAAHGACS